MDFTMYYWPGFTGRAEPILMLLKEAGKSYNIDNDVMGAVKADNGFPVFACPILKRNEDGVTVSQTTAILQWIGSEYGLGGSGLQSVRALQTACNAADLWSEAYNGRKAEDGGAAFLANRLGKWFDIFEATLAKSASDFTTDSLTYADYAVFNVVRAVEWMFSACAPEVEGRENLKKFMKAMEERPAMKEYLATALPLLYDGVKAQ